ncbi:UNVERIFIED_CONTAM: hypothetical protein Q9R58_23610 [Methylobacteriaceae bacterium AG10]|nr:hypothetical protein [Methylobacteriaceae bacterium AG10]
MGVGIASERRLLSEDELERIKLSHYPDLGKLEQDDAIALARWLRERRNRVRDIVRTRRRARRGKADASGIGSAEASERGLSAKKQVFARAIRRVNAKLERFRVKRRREQMRANLGEALRRRQTRPRQHPATEERHNEGMRPIANEKRFTELEPSQIGRVSQSVKAAQAKRDAD